MDKRKSRQKGNLEIIILLAVVAIILALALYSVMTKTNPLTQIQSLFEGKPPPAAISSSQSQVIITSQGFEPATLQIEKGHQVTWLNQDQSPHQVASDPHPTHTNLSGFDSEEPLAKDDSFSFIF